MNENGECDRLNLRRTVLLQARCRKSSWNVFPVELGDLSEGGCCIVGSSESFDLGEDVSLRIANLKPIAGQVRWIRGVRVGVEFRAALNARIIAELARVYGITVNPGTLISADT